MDILVSSSMDECAGTEENCLPRRLLAILFRQHCQERPNMDYSLLVVTLSLLRATSGPNQLGLVAKNVKEYVWL